MLADGLLSWEKCDLDDVSFEQQLQLHRMEFVDTVRARKNPPLSRLPLVLFEFSMMTTLSLCKNGLLELPAEIARLKNLFHLGLRGNQLRVLPNTIGNMTTLGGLDLRNNKLVRLPWSMQRLQLCDVYLSGNEKLPFNDDICSDHDEAVCSLLSDIARRYSCCGAREAVICLWLMHRFGKECCFRTLPSVVIKHVLIPFVWTTRYDEEWSIADDLAFHEDVDLADVRRNYPCWEY